MVAVRAGRPAHTALRAGPHAESSVSPSGHVDPEAHPTASVPLGRAWTLAVACGVVDAVANVFLLLALRGGGDLAVVSALTALYPAGTVLLAALVLRERIATVQWIGLVLALIAGVLLAVG